MTALAKATLQEIKSDKSRAPIGQAVEVQFNPTSLKLKLANKIEGGGTRSRPKRQYIGSSSSVLTLELVFDTADEGKTNKPLSVREKTNFLEKFILPKKKGAKESPPKLQFSWGSLVFEGIVEGLSFDFDHFAGNGTPLRAKASLSIKEQDAEYQFLKRGTGTSTADGAKDPGSSSAAAPGSEETPTTDSTAPAVEGETPADFLARQGLDPAAWRGLDLDLGLGLSLEAGLEIGFSAELSASLGVGVSLGAEIGVDLSLEASVGLEAEVGASLNAGSDADKSAGFALAAAGGVEAALESVETAKGANAAQETLEAFQAPGAWAAPVKALAGAAGERRALPATASQERQPLTASGVPTPAQQAAAQSAPPRPRADTRATSYGFGVPLRPRPNLPDVSAGEAPIRRQPSGAPWEALPERDSGRQAAAESERATGDCCCTGGRKR